MSELLVEFIIIKLAFGKLYHQKFRRIIRIIAHNQQLTYVFNARISF